MAVAPGRQAFVLVNGLQLLQCQLPAPSERTCFVHAEVSGNLRVMADHGRMELACVFYSSADVTEEHRPWVATLEIDGTECIELGQLPRAGGETRVVARYLPEHPQSFQFTVRHDDRPSYPHPEEEQLVREIQLVLLSHDPVMPPRAPVPLSHLQNKIEGLELYKRVIAHYNKRLSNFVAQHTEELALFQVPGEETRIAVPDAPATAPSGFAEQEEQLEAEAVEAVRALLHDSDMSLTELLGRLRTVPAFCRHLKASSNVFFRFLRRHRTAFWVEWDPVQTSRVGCRRQ